MNIRTTVSPALLLLAALTIVSESVGRSPSCYLPASWHAAGRWAVPGDQGRQGVDDGHARRRVLTVLLLP